MQESIKSLRKHGFSASSVPIALLLLCVISYIPLIQQLGFYWDDWPSIFYLHFLGPDSFLDAFSIDRPLLGWIFAFTTQLVGESTINWQLFGIITRWLCSLSFWWTFKLLWPNNPKQVAWAALLFAIYPGFSQQYISVTYSNAFLVFSIFLASYATMILATRKKAWFWPLSLISLASSAFALFTSEYFFGLELLRPVILFLVIQKDTLKQRFLQASLRWLPYLAIMTLFLFWRVYLTETPRGEIQIFGFLQSNPLYALLYLIWTVSTDFLQVSLLAWSRIFSLDKLMKFNNRYIMVYFIITISTSILAVNYFFRFIDEKSRQIKITTDLTWSKQAILFGAYAMIIAGLPFWVVYLPIKLQFPQDRFTMPMMVGACIFLVGLVEFTIKKQNLIVVLLGILIGITVGFHYYNGLIYARAWDFQKAFFWQLTWRVPAIEPGTLLLAPELPFTYYSDNSLTAPLNWTYAPNNISHQIPYIIFDLDARLYNSINSFERGIPVEGNYRAMNFNGSTSQVLGFFFAPPRCVTIIDPKIEQLIPNQEVYIPEALALSDPGWIDGDKELSAQLPKQYFGGKPTTSWCYYFEKADLARQFGKWEQIVDLGDQAKSFRDMLIPANAIEMTPFVEGYAKTYKWEKALEWSQKAYNKNQETQARLCTIWQETFEQNPNNKIPLEIINHLEKELKCK